MIDIQQDQRQRLLGALGIGPFAGQHRVEHAPVGDAGETVLVGVFLQLLLQGQQLFLSLLALADVEHEADQRIHLAVVVAHHVHHVANPHVVASGGQRTVVSLMIDAVLRLRDAELHHLLAVVRVHACRPVFGADPAGLRPAQQRLDLRADVGEGHGLPVDLPRDRPGGLEQGLVDGAIVFYGFAHGGLA